MCRAACVHEGEVVGRVVVCAMVQMCVGSGGSVVGKVCRQCVCVEPKEGRKCSVWGWRCVQRHEVV